MGVIAKRSSMTLLSDPSCHYSHRVRIVLAEKDVTVKVVDVDPENKPPELKKINPYNTLPTLVDRDLVVFHSRVMMEYLDERFPHPPLLPVYPIARANSRLLSYRIEQDWSRLVNIIVDPKVKETPKQRARKELRDSLNSVSEIFAEHPFFMSNEFSLVDCILAPILWRLSSLDIHLSESPAIARYSERMFTRHSFNESLSDAEREMMV